MVVITQMDRLALLYALGLEDLHLIRELQHGR
jgi:hypothetical protein